MPQSDFRFEQPASDTPVMRAPGIEVSFHQGKSWDYELRFENGSPALEPGPGRWLVRPATGDELEVGPPDPRRIANPVYQAFVPHELAVNRGPGLCALLTGSCFDHHFSAVFSLYSDPEMPTRMIFEVDLADRCRTSVEELAATYLICDATGSAAAISASSNRVAWEGASEGDGLLELIAVAPAKLDEPTAFSTATRVQVQARIDPGTHTQRLHYRWRWASCAGLTR